LTTEFEPRIVGLTGSVGAIRQMAQEYRVYFRKIEEEGEDYLVESSHDMQAPSSTTAFFSSHFLVSSSSLA
jgi:cytochrome oxidase Cu insertion factor (SCO1/SenC/PrrC family)